MKYNANLDVKGAIVASSASISSLNAIQAISVAGSSVTSGTVVFSNSNNVSWGINAGTITASVSGVSQTQTVYEWPAAQMGCSGYAGSRASFATDAASTTTSGRIFFSPFILPFNLAYSNVVMPLSLNFAAGTNSFTVGVHYGLYTTDGNGSLARHTSFGFNFIVSKNGATQTWRYWWGNGTDSAGTDGNTTSTSSDANLSTAFSGVRWTDVGPKAARTLTAGMYVMAQLITQYSTGTGLTVSPVAADIEANANSNWIGVLSTFMQGAGATTARMGRGWGIISTTSAGATWGDNMLPSVINTANITSTTGQPTLLFNPLMLSFYS